MSEARTLSEIIYSLTLMSYYTSVTDPFHNNTVEKESTNLPLARLNVAEPWRAKDIPHIIPGERHDDIVKQTHFRD
jgi:hypothetical protein